MFDPGGAWGMAACGSKEGAVVSGRFRIRITRVPGRGCFDLPAADLADADEAVVVGDDPVAGEGDAIDVSAGAEVFLGAGGA